MCTLNREVMPYSKWARLIAEERKARDRQDGIDWDATLLQLMEAWERGEHAELPPGMVQLRAERATEPGCVLLTATLDDGWEISKTISFLP
jgi:hypothetical protein